ncbi:MAG TPA: DUF488 domain-containing protein [Dehalococcoidia bacterium]|nr:DUF488 domain-containing protein [Dehalococcoidia bacterium]
MILFTIGHSTAELADFIDVLRTNEVELVADVRSKPRSRMPHFDQYALQAALDEAGIRYRFLGDRLGGVPNDPRVAARWRQGHLDPVIVAHLRSTDGWQDGLVELTRLMTSGGGARVCVLCSEGDPNECHRKAVALDAAELVTGTEVVHLSVNKAAPSEVGVQEVLL